MSLFHKGIRPFWGCPYFFALRPGHRPDHDPADTGEIHFARIVKQWLKGNVIVICPDIGLKRVDAPQL